MELCALAAAPDRLRCRLNVSGKTCFIERPCRNDELLRKPPKAVRQRRGTGSPCVQRSGGAHMAFAGNGRVSGLASVALGG